MHRQREGHRRRVEARAPRSDRRVARDAEQREPRPDERLVGAREPGGRRHGHPQHRDAEHADALSEPEEALDPEGPGQRRVHEAGERPRRGRQAEDAEQPTGLAHGLQPVHEALSEPEPDAGEALDRGAPALREPAEPAEERPSAEHHHREAAQQHGHGGPGRDPPERDPVDLGALHDQHAARHGHEPRDERDHHEHGAQIDRPLQEHRGEPGAGRDAVLLEEEERTNDLAEPRRQRVDEQEAHAEHRQARAEGVLRVAGLQDERLAPGPERLLDEEDEGRGPEPQQVRGGQGLAHVRERHAPQREGQRADPEQQPDHDGPGARPQQRTQPRGRRLGGGGAHARRRRKKARGASRSAAAAPPAPRQPQSSAGASTGFVSRRYSTRLV